MKKKVILFGVSMLAICALPALATPDAKQIERLVQRHAELDMFSGSVVVAVNGKTLYAGAFGHANKDHNIPNTLNTRYNIGSIGKVFTGTAIMQLVQAGKLSLDDPLGKHLPDYPHPEKATITIQHLLNHSSGIGDYMEHPEYSAKMGSIRYVADILPLIYSTKPASPAGEQFTYSNSAMVLLGAIIEKISGLSYPDYLQQKLFVPAGMADSVLAQEQDVLPNRAIGYSPSADGQYQVNVRAVMPASADGGVRVTALDLLRFDQAIHADRLLNAVHRQQMLKPVGPVPFAASGWFVQKLGDQTMVGHSGGAPGISAEYRHYENGYTLIVLSNYEHGAPPVTQQVERLLFDQAYTLPTKPDAEYALATHAMQQEQHEIALPIFDRLASQEQPHLEALYASARLRIVDRVEPEKAIVALSRYIELAGAEAQPSLGSAWWRKGNAHELLGDNASACQCYETAIALEPNDPKLRDAFAKCSN